MPANSRWDLIRDLKGLKKFKLPFLLPTFKKITKRKTKPKNSKFILSKQSAASALLTTLNITVFFAVLYSLLTLA